MNSGGNALGQGNRANATIGRALQLLIRNVGGGKPGGIDRATLGNPGKYTFCFAEDESDDAWSTLAMDQGYSREESVVSLFAGDGVQPILDQLSRTPESLAKSMASSLRSVVHVKSSVWPMPCSWYAPNTDGCCERTDGTSRIYCRPFTTNWLPRALSSSAGPAASRKACRTD